MIRKPISLVDFNKLLPRQNLSPCTRVNLTKSLQVLIVSRKAQDSDNADETDDPQDSEHFRFLVARLSRIIRLELLYDNINNINYVQAERLFVFFRANQIQRKILKKIEKLV